MLTTYARAVLPLVPGASRLPFVAGGGGEMPTDLVREVEATTDPARLAAYAKVCGFRVRDEVPATWPHILAFPEHMALMTDGRFPFGAVGLVHVANLIEQRRPIRVGEPIALSVRPTAIEPHPKGRAFSLVTEARVAGELAWVETSTMLRRGGGEGGGGSEGGASGESGEETVAGGGAEAPGGGADEPGEDRSQSAAATAAPESAVQWKVPGDIGRRYAGVSGDRNPIHLHDLTAKAFGFPRAIAHGMWTKAHALAALEGRLPDAFTVDVAFKRPILLPATVAFVTAERRFAVRDARSGEPHLEAEVTL